MAIFMLSLAGVPPTAGFLAKFYIFGAAVQGGYGWLAIVAVLNSVLAAYYYLRVIVIMYMREPAGQVAKMTLSPALALAIFLAVIGTVQLGLFPAAVVELAQASLFPFLGS
jgi:NADH-quinone oxidoreductase subunit N